MRLLLSAVVLVAVAGAARAASADPVQEASDWRALIMAAVREGAQQDPKACQACAQTMNNLPGCQGVKVDDLTTADKEGHCEGQCTVGRQTAWDKVVERLRADKACAASAADPAVVKQMSEAFGADLAPGMAQCGRCRTAADLAKWPERRKALMQLFGRLDEGAGKVDAASRAAALEPALAEARAQFQCAGDKIEPSSCALAP